MQVWMLNGLCDTLLLYVWSTLFAVGYLRTFLVFIFSDERDVLGGVRATVAQVCAPSLMCCGRN